MNITQPQVEKLLVTSGLGSNLSAVTELGSGYRNHNWKVTTSSGQYVLRVRYFADKDSATRLREASVLKLLDGKFGAPKLYFFSASEPDFDDSAVLIIEYFDGKQLPREQLSQAHLNFLTDFMLGLHSHTYSQFNLKGIEPNQAGTLADIAGKSVSKVEEYAEYLTGKLSQPDLALIQDRADQLKTTTHASWTKSNFALIHGDFGTYNTLEHNGEYKVIDWEKAKITDPVTELSRFVAHLDVYYAAQDADYVVQRYRDNSQLEWFDERLNFWYIFSLIDTLYWSNINLERSQRENNDGLKHQIAKCIETLRKYDLIRSPRFGALD